MSRAKRWCFTLNNYTEEEKECIKACGLCTYIIFGKEVGESGTPHLQGFVVFSKQLRMKQAKEQLGVKRVHLEVAKGNVEQNVTYCTKEDTEAFELGEKPEDGHAKGGKRNRERYDAAWHLAKEGNFEEIDADIRIRSYGTLKRIRRDTILARTLKDTEAKHLWYCGPTGTGKSRKARGDNPNAYLKMCNKWWDGYTDEDVVIIEDFDERHAMLAHHMKIWADRYPFPAEVKGGAITIRPKLLIVTSNYHPEDIWKDERDLDPILRRFEIVRFNVLE